MLYPSIDALMEKVNSKYALVTVSAARARKLRDNPELIDEEEAKNFKSVSYVGKALEEIHSGKIGVGVRED